MKTDRFDGLGTHMGNLSRLSAAESRSISPESLTGEKGRGGMSRAGTGATLARDLGQGWKVSPSVHIDAGATFELASIAGPGAIQQIWMTPAGNWRLLVLRVYWDHQPQPSIECPLGDFFASGWGRFAQISSLAVCVNPASALNCYWEMPFRKHCRVTLTNLNDGGVLLYYQISYALTEVPEDAGYFHAQFRRSNPVSSGVHTLLDGVAGQGHFVGTYLAWGAREEGWWGEGEIKFYIDGDTEFPTIVGTGTEDYVGGSYGFLDPESGQYRTYTTPHSGFHQVIHPDGATSSETRFGMYRWHITDPVRFQRDLRVTIQALGIDLVKERYLLRKDDVASVAYWYQTLPAAPFPALPDKAALEIL